MEAAHKKAPAGTEAEFWSTLETVPEARQGPEAKPTSD